MVVHFINLYNYLERNYVAQKTLESWKRFMPQLEIKIWTENDEFIKDILNDENDNFIKSCKGYDYSIERIYSIERLSDYLRLKIIYEFGGIFSELDYFLLKPFEFDEEKEFCQSLPCINTIFPNDNPFYFKKKNILVKIKLEQLEREAKPELFFGGKDSAEEYQMYLMKKISEILKDSNYPKEEIFKELERINKNSFEFFSKNKDYVLHLFDWWVGYNYIVITSNKEIFESALSQGYAAYLFSDRKGFFPPTQVHIKFLEIYKRYLKYSFKIHNYIDKVIDAEELLGDIENITEEDYSLDEFLK